jgi:hypothetical protein
MTVWGFVKTKRSERYFKRAVQSFSLSVAQDVVMPVHQINGDLDVVTHMFVLLKNGY